MTLLEESAPDLALVDEWEAPPPQQRRRVRGVPTARVRDLIGAALAGASVSLLLVQFTALSGPVGVVLVAYLAFLVIYGVLVSLSEDRPAVADAIATVLMATAAVIAFGALALVVGYTVVRGW